MSRKNRKKHDPLNYYNNRAEADAVEARRASEALGAISSVSVPLHVNVPSFSFDGGYWGRAQTHRTGAAGSSVHGSSDGTGAGTSARMKMDEFSGTGLMIDPVLEEVGFAVGVVRGVRAFDVDALGRLRGVTYKHIWTPGENEAECRRNRSDALWAQFSFTLNVRGGLSVGETEKKPIDYDQPHTLSDCKHGFYAYYDGSNDYHDEGRVSAVIEGYGETVIGSRGFRCMKARIVALHIPTSVKPHTARLVARNYPDIPILESFDQMVSEFPPDSAGNELTPDTDPDFWTRSV
ncbi:hypothetical protein [Microbacterium sp. NPDC087592]|uniref:hypothetical protein n=1 Tax=Microbacterium sp. NPDC087592 TaxID=3364193 RepID=UPI0037F1835F